MIKIWEITPKYANIEVRINPNHFAYEYYLQDHLYNNRVMFRVNADGSLKVTQVQNYYPFGSDMGDTTMNYTSLPNNLHKYNGNEWQPELALNTYDFGARHYNAQLARWMVIDPMAEASEELSPYNYVENNPMNMIDPDGMQPKGGITSSLSDGSVPVPGGDLSGPALGGSAGSGGALGALGSGLSLLSGVANGISAAKVFGSWRNVAVQDLTGIKKLQNNNLFLPGRQATASQWQPGLSERFQNSNMVNKALYDITDNAYIAVTSVFWPSGDVTHINGVSASAREQQVAFFSTASLAIPLGKGASAAKIVIEDAAKEGVIDLTENAAAKSGSTTANRLGQLIHKAYKLNEVLPGVRIKEFTLPSGLRIDFIDFEKKIIYELKPNNPKAIKLGEGQLNKYLREVESIYGKGFKTVLDKY